MIIYVKKTFLRTDRRTDGQPKTIVRNLTINWSWFRKMDKMKSNLNFWIIINNKHFSYITCSLKKNQTSIYLSFRLVIFSLLKRYLRPPKHRVNKVLQKKQDLRVLFKFPIQDTPTSEEHSRDRKIFSQIVLGLTLTKPTLVKLVIINIIKKNTYNKEKGRDILGGQVGPTECKQERQNYVNYLIHGNFNLNINKILLGSEL